VTRLNAFAMGTLTAYLQSQGGFREWLKKARWFRMLSLLSGVIVVVLNAQWSTWFREGVLLEAPGTCATQIYQQEGGLHHILYYLFFTVGSPLSAYLFCYIIFVMVESIGTVGRLLNRILSHRWWYPVAQLSYAAYLMHPIVIMCTELAGGTFDVTNLTLVFVNAVWYVVVVLAISTVFYVLLEKPVEVFLRNHDHPWLSKATLGYVILLAGVSILMHSVAYYALATFKIPADIAVGAPDPRIAEGITYKAWLAAHPAKAGP